MPSPTWSRSLLGRCAFIGWLPSLDKREFRAHDMGTVGPVPQSNLITESPAVIAKTRQKSTQEDTITNLSSLWTGTNRPDCFGLLAG